MCHPGGMGMTLLFACLLGGQNPAPAPDGVSSAVSSAATVSSSSSEPTFLESCGARCANPVDPVMNGITIGGVVGGLVGGASLVGFALVGLQTCSAKGPCEGPGLALFSTPAGVVVGGLVGAVAGGFIGGAVEHEPPPQDGPDA